MTTAFAANAKIPVCVILYKDEYKNFSSPYCQTRDPF